MNEFLLGLLFLCAVFTPFAVWWQRTLEADRVERRQMTAMIRCIRNHDVDGLVQLYEWINRPINDGGHDGPPLPPLGWAVRFAMHGHGVSDLTPSLTALAWLAAESNTENRALCLSMLLSPLCGGEVAQTGRALDVLRVMCRSGVAIDLSLPDRAGKTLWSLLILSSCPRGPRRDDVDVALRLEILRTLQSLGAHAEQEWESRCCPIDFWKRLPPRKWTLRTWIEHHRPHAEDKTRRAWLDALSTIVRRATTVNI